MLHHRLITGGNRQFHSNLRAYFLRLTICSLRVEDSEVAGTSERSVHGLNVVTGLVSVSERDGDVAVWAITSLTPDDNSSSWELWKVGAGESLDLSKVGSGGELISALVSTVARQENGNGSVNGISNCRIAFADGVTRFGNG